MVLSTETAVTGPVIAVDYLKTFVQDYPLGLHETCRSQTEITVICRLLGSAAEKVFNHTGKEMNKQ